MAVVLVWNVNENPLVDGLVQDLAREHQVDLVLAVEYAHGMSQLPGLLEADGLIRRASRSRFGVFSRPDHRIVRLRHQLGARVELWVWQPPGGQEGLLVLLHGLDRRNHDESARRVFFRRVANAVFRRERKYNHKRTLITGDFNAQPFESAIADSDGLHAIGMLTVKKRSQRIFGRTSDAAEFFYNPMWRVYGHDLHRDAGAASYYWHGGGAGDGAWLMLDQVVFRPGEASRFPENQLRIVTKIGSISLLDVEGRPKRGKRSAVSEGRRHLRATSDHLPILFQWNL